MSDPQEDAQSPAERRTLMMEVYAGLQVINAKQTEINRRIGNIEKAIEALRSDQLRLAALEADVVDLKAALEDAGEVKRDWWTWGLQTAGSIVITSLLIWVGMKIGVPITNG